VTGSIGAIRLMRTSSGEVDIGAFRSTNSISGSYDLTFDNGEHKTGQFAANYCKAYDDYAAAAANSRYCSATGSGGVCSRACSCGAKLMSATCDSAADGGYQCTCATATGSTTCMMTASPDCSSDTGTCRSFTL
jgi:hypothetical protein